MPGLGGRIVSGRQDREVLEVDLACGDTPLQELVAGVVHHRARAADEDVVRDEITAGRADVLDGDVVKRGTAYRDHAKARAAAVHPWLWATVHADP
jgi:hypothetical protein